MICTCCDCKISGDAQRTDDGREWCENCFFHYAPPTPRETITARRIAEWTARAKRIETSKRCSTSS